MDPTSDEDASVELNQRSQLGSSTNTPSAYPTLNGQKVGPMPHDALHEARAQLTAAEHATIALQLLAAACILPVLPQRRIWDAQPNLS